MVLSQFPKPIPVYAVHPVELWAPLALGMMTAWIAQEAGDSYRPIYPYALSGEQLREQVQTHGPGVVLFSNYMWTRRANLEISADIKAFAPECVIIHGGPDTPAYPHANSAYLEQYPFVDYCIHGEGEQTLLALLQTLAAGQSPHEVEGLGLRYGGEVIKTPPRARSQDLNHFPSPYLTGVFDTLPWQHWSAATLESNRGCPYGCTFCDWGSATRQKMRLFDLERVEAEIDWIARHQIPKLWIADSNFGIFERDLTIARMVCEAKARYGFPKLLITNYAKNTKQHLIEIIELLVEHGLVSTGIVSMQTRDAATLKAVKRSNIKTGEYDRLRQAFEARKLPMSTQLMIGLPGSTLESFKADLRFFFNQTLDVQIFRTAVLPNSPMAAPEYMAEHQLEVDENGMLRATAQLSSADLDQIEQLARLFRCAHTYGMFRYWLCFLNWDYGIDPIDYLDALQQFSQNTSGWLAQLWEQESPLHDMLTTHPTLRETLRAESAWRSFYQELKAFTLAHYPQVQDDSALETVLQVQIAVMPHASQHYPLQVHLAHDFVRYYASHQQGGSGQPLLSEDPGKLMVSDPLNVSHESLFQQLRERTRPIAIWELLSPLSPEGTEATLFISQSLAERAV